MTNPTRQGFDAWTLYCNTFRDLFSHLKPLELSPATLQAFAEKLGATKKVYCLRCAACTPSLMDETLPPVRSWLCHYSGATVTEKCGGCDCLQGMAATRPSPTEAPDYKALYLELLMQVANKYPGETRHQTALRYLQRAERGTCEPGKGCDLKEARP